MGKLIDADDLKRDLIDRGFYPAIVKVALEQAPEAAVRCKECKKCAGFYENDFGPDGRRVCAVDGLIVKPDDFCSRGRRRTK